VGHYGPKFEAEKDEILSHYLRERGQETSIYLFFRLGICDLDHRVTLMKMVLNHQKGRIHYKKM
jgi:hypothetical protein